MRTRTLLASVLASGAALAAGAGSASSQPPTWSFVDCAGPAGTPSSFTAVHGQSNAAAWPLADGTTVFVALIFVDVTAGKQFSPPGHASGGNATVVCTTVNPFNGHVLRLSGFLTADR